VYPVSTQFDLADKVAAIPARSRKLETMAATSSSVDFAVIFAI